MFNESGVYDTLPNVDSKDDIYFRLLKPIKAHTSHTQRGIVTSSRENARDMLDYQFNGNGYIYHFGSFWAVYTK